MKKQSNEFEKGYLCATAEILRCHDEPTIAIDVFGGCAMRISEMRKIGIAEEDIEVLEPIIKEFYRRRKLKCNT